MRIAYRNTLILISLLMIVVSAYLSWHYFEVKYDGGGGSLCHINQFFNCDTAVTSLLSNVAGIPISIFGLAIGLITLFGSIANDKKVFSTLWIFLTINFLGCLGLFLFSLFILHGLCPFCTVYYVLSALAFFFVWRGGPKLRFESKSFLVAAGVIFIAGVAGFIWDDFEARLASGIIPAKNVESGLTKVPSAILASEYKLATSATATIKMALFSDFQCPGCKTVSEMIPEFKKRYGDRIDIQYYFFPLDNSCNPNMDRPLHPFACQAAEIAACLPDKFEVVHDELFQNQSIFSKEWLDDYARKNGVFNCMNKLETRQKVIDIIRASQPIEVGVTPTLVVNGYKIEGGRPLPQMFQLIDGLEGK